MIVKNDNDLIGDFIGTIPAMQALPEAEFIIKDGVSELFDMTGLKRSYATDHDMAFDLHAAFALADREQLHMTQANYHFVGLQIPHHVPKAKLTYPDLNATAYDYVIAPFSRSLPQEQKWQREKWQALVDALPDKSFCVLGAKSDPIDFIRGDNVTPLFGQSFAFVCNLLERSQLISVVTGISHLAHALGIKNYLFVNQGTWGKNPDAVYFDNHIPDIEVHEVINKLV